MHCNISNKCNKCSTFYKTTSVVVTGDRLVLTIPNMEITNCQKFCIQIAQPIPVTATSTTNLVISINGIAYSAISPCCANNIYADQLKTGKTYCFRFATDTGCFIYKCGWRLCPTAHVFPIIPVLPSETLLAVEATLSGQTESIKRK